MREVLEQFALSYKSLAANTACKHNELNSDTRPVFSYTLIGDATAANSQDLVELIAHDLAAAPIEQVSPDLLSTREHLRERRHGILAVAQSLLPLI
jgi:hypothetical protein